MHISVIIQDNGNCYGHRKKNFINGIFSGTTALGVDSRDGCGVRLNLAYHRLRSVEALANSERRGSGLEMSWYFRGCMGK